MAAAELTETRVGALGQVVTITGKAVKIGIYTATKATQNDWVILGDFEVVQELLACYTTSSGARTAEAYTIDTSTTNKVTLTSATTNPVSIVAIGY